MTKIQLVNKKHTHSMSSKRSGNSHPNWAMPHYFVTLLGPWKGVRIINKCSLPFSIHALQSVYVTMNTLACICHNEWPCLSDIYIWLSQSCYIFNLTDKSLLWNTVIDHSISMSLIFPSRSRSLKLIYNLKGREHDWAKNPNSRHFWQSSDWQTARVIKRETHNYV